MAALKANAHERRKTEYAYDLMWMLVRAKYDKFSAPMPSEVGKLQKKDTRTAAQIKEDLLKKLTA